MDHRPYYQDDLTTIYCAECCSVLDAIDFDYDCTITDPPYGTTSLKWDRWQKGWLERIYPSGKSLWCFGTARTFFKNSADFEEWHLCQEVIWEKQNGSGLLNDRFRQVHENIWHFHPRNVKWSDLYHFTVVSMDAQKRRLLRQQKPAHWGGLKSSGVFEKEEGGERIMRSVVYCQNMHRKAIHPTEKPIGILIPLILSSVPENGVVLDPFMGSGSTLRAARELGRRSIGIEINEAYCEAAVKALSQNVMVLV